MKRYVLLILLMLVAVAAIPQSGDSFSKTFTNGKELYKMERYGLAMQALKPLTSSYNDNPYLKQATFYYGVSAFNENQIEVAKNSFEYLKSNFPQWDQADEVNLWLMKCALARNKFEEAIIAFKNLKKDDAKEYGTNLLLGGFNSLTEYDTVKSLYDKHPENKAVAVKMANAISEQPLLEQNKQLLYEIVDKFKLDDEKYRIIDTSKSEKKNQYSVAVLLPFMIGDLQNNRQIIRNQFVIDLYQGLLLGGSELRTMGIKLNFLAYDTEKSAFKVKQILEKPELQHVDLIYGPLYPNPVKITNQFSFEYKINMFNPLSSNSQVIGNNPYSFLYMPSYETQGKFAANIVLQKAPRRNGFVFYGEEERDSLVAYSFANEMKSRGDSTINMFKIGDANSKRIIQILTDGTEVEEVDERGNVSKINLFKIPKDSLGYIFVASENPSLAASTITALETRGDSTLFVGMEKWLSSQIISYDALERLNTYLLAPIYLDKGKSQYKYFENAYKEKYNAIPSINACLGYETAMLLGKLLHKHGNHFQNEFDQGYVKGELFSNYSLNYENDNQNIPIVKFMNSELVEIKTNY